MGKQSETARLPAKARTPEALVTSRAFDWIMAWSRWFNPLHANDQLTEPRQTALAELAILVIQLGRCPRLEPEVHARIELLRQIVLGAYSSPVLHRFINYGPVEAAIGDLVIWLALKGHGGEDIVPRRSLMQAIRDRNIIALERNPMRMLELRYFLDLAGIPHRIPTAAELCRHSILGHKLNLDTLTDQSIYQVTHIIYYASDFGALPRHRIPLNRSVDRIVRQLLHSMIEARHWDLVAELVLAHRCLGLRDSPLVAQAWRQLKDAEERGDLFTFDAGLARVQTLSEKHNELFFLSTYHKPLVTTLAGHLPCHRAADR